jgi:filamentous hemagglutinin
VVTGSDTSGRIDNNFDPNATKVALAISSAFTASAAPIAANIVGNVAQEKETAAKLQAQTYADLAEKAADPATAQMYREKAAEAQATAESWGDNGVNRLALHSAAQGLIGGLTNGNVGALTSVAGVAGGNLGQQLGAKLGADAAEQQELSEEDRKKLINTYQETLATIGGAIAGMATSSAGGNVGQNGLATALSAGGTATTVDVYNRQLHPDEVQLLKKQQQGKSPAEQQKLADAACALVHCSASVPDGPTKDILLEQERRGQSYIIEQSLLQRTGQFKYDLTDKLGDFASWTGGEAANEVKNVTRGAINLGYQILTHGPNGVPQTPPDLPDDFNGPRPSGGTVLAVPMPLCVPPFCALAAVPVLTPGTPGYRPGNVYFSDGGNEQGNGTSNNANGTASAAGAKGGSGVPGASTGTPKTTQAGATNGQGSAIIEGEPSTTNSSYEVLAKVNSGRAPFSEINGSIGELNGYQQALDSGRIGIVKPGKASAPGVDYATFDPAQGVVYITDAKYRGPGGSYPSSISQKSFDAWTQQVQSTVTSWPDSPVKSAILDAIRSGRVRPEIFKWPQ